MPVILRKCLWYEHPEIARLQALPTDAHPIFDKTHWPDPEDGFFDTAEGFKRLLEDPDTEARRQRREKQNEPDRLKLEALMDLKERLEESAKRIKQQSGAAEEKQMKSEDP